MGKFIYPGYLRQLSLNYYQLGSFVGVPNAFNALIWAMRFA